MKTRCRRRSRPACSKRSSRARRWCSDCRPAARRSVCIASSASGARGDRDRLVAGAHLQPRRVRRPRAVDPEQLSRVHAGGAVRSRFDRSGQHRLPQRRRRRSEGRVPALRRGDRGGRRHRSADSRHRRQRPHRLQRAGRRPVRAHPRRGARASEQGSERAAVRRRLDRGARARAVDGHGDDSQRAADRADRDRRGKGRRRARNDRRIDYDAAAGVVPAGAPARDGDAGSRGRRQDYPAKPDATSAPDQRAQARLDVFADRFANQIVGLPQARDRLRRRSGRSSASRSRS